MEGPTPVSALIHAATMVTSGIYLFCRVSYLVVLSPTAMITIAMLLRLAGLFQVFDGIQVTGIGILRGVGDTRAPLIANLVGYWALGLPLSLFLGFGLKLGPAGLWWGFVLGLAVVAVWMWFRVRTQMGRTQKRIVLEDVPAT